MKSQNLKLKKHGHILSSHGSTEREGLVEKQMSTHDGRSLYCPLALSESDDKLPRELSRKHSGAHE